MRVRLFLSLSCFSMLLAPAASAHVDLTAPPARLLGSANGNQIKIGPCGQTTNMRTATVTTFTPGQTIDVKIEEYVDHTGYYAVGFDNDGDNDLPFPRANSDAVNPQTDDPKALFPIGDKILGYHMDAADGNCADNPDRACTISVKLPNVQCQTCTLQLVQFMYDKTGDGDPNEHYFQCADIKIEGQLMPGGGAGGVGGTAGGGGAGGTGGAAVGGTGGASGAPVGGTPSAGTAGSVPAGGSPTGGVATGGTGTPGLASTTDESSCTISRAAGYERAGLASLAASLLLGLGWFARRRQRSR